MKTLKLIKSDTYLRPYAEAIEGRYNYALKREQELTGGKTLSEWANGYLYFGLHKIEGSKSCKSSKVAKWVLREWAPNATAIYMIGDFNNWQKDEAYRLQPVGDGVWEVVLNEDMIKHEQLYKLLVEWYGGKGERIPSYTNRVVQDPVTKLFAAQVWAPTEQAKGEEKKG